VTDLDVRPLTGGRWPDFVDLFERRGPRGGHRNTPAYGCWCMFWRDRALEHGTPKKRAMGAIVRRGRVPGLLAYSGGEAVGWVSVSPREEYEALLRSPQYRPRDEDEGVWSIVCFVVDKPVQGSGFAEALLDAAVAHARGQGAAAVEAYPHGTRQDDYMGRLGLFRARGFRTTRRTSSRAVVRLALS
jgi:GNAT superfamily N-acetyltransferase